MLFRDAAAAWLSSRPDLKETTRAAYRDALAPTDPSNAYLAKRHKPLADLRIDAVFGGYPINAITRDDIRKWVARMQAAGKRPSTIRNAYFLVRMVLAQAVEDNGLPANPADYVKLPTDHNTGTGAAVDDPTQFLTAAQVAALVAATPWPYDVMVHLAAWSGLRAAELAGSAGRGRHSCQSSLNPNARAKPGALRVDRTVARIGGELTYLHAQDQGQPPHGAVDRSDDRAVGRLPSDSTHAATTRPRRCSRVCALLAPRPTGVRGDAADGERPRRVHRASATAGDRPGRPRRGRGGGPAAARLGRAASGTPRSTRPCTGPRCCGPIGLGRRGDGAALPPQLKFHASGTPTRACASRRADRMFEVARFMGHAKRHHRRPGLRPPVQHRRPRRRDGGAGREFWHTGGRTLAGLCPLIS